MFPFASAGGRQLRRMNRLETRTGTTSLGAEGSTLELGIAEEEGEEAVRGVGTTGGQRAGKQSRPSSKHRMAHPHRCYGNEDKPGKKQ